MAVKLSKKELENIKNYKYATNPWTFCDNLYDPWWTFIVNNLSKVKLYFIITFKFSTNIFC